MEPCGHQQSMSVRVDAGTMIQGQMKFALEKEKASMRPDKLTPICDSARICISLAFAYLGQFLVSISWIWSNRKKRHDRGHILIYSEVNSLGRPFAFFWSSCNEYPKGVWTEPKIAPDRLYWRHVIVHKLREDAGIGKSVSNPNHFGIMPLLDMAKVYPEKFGLWCRHSRCHGQVAPWLSTK